MSEQRAVGLGLAALAFVLGVLAIVWPVVWLVVIPITFLAAAMLDPG